METVEVAQALWLRLEISRWELILRNMQLSSRVSRAISIKEVWVLRRYNSITQPGKVIA